LVINSEFEGGIVYRIKNRNNPNKSQNPSPSQIEQLQDMQTRLISNHRLFKKCNTTQKNEVAYNKVSDFVNNFTAKYIEIPEQPISGFEYRSIPDYKKISILYDMLKLLTNDYYSTFEHISNFENSPSALINLVNENNSKINYIIDKVISENNIKKNLQTGLWE
jgi:hypothetical protein